MRIAGVGRAEVPAQAAAGFARAAGLSAARCGKEGGGGGPRGKRVVIELDTGDRIVIEPRMTGLVLLAAPPTQEHLRFRIQFEGNAPDVWYWDRRGLGSVQLLSPEQFTAKLGADKLGPDALTATPELLQERFGNSGRPIKVALLDQKALAGVGNLYASEILHLAGVHPARPSNSLRPADSARFTPPCWKCWNWRSAMKVRRCPTAPTATRSTKRAAIRTSIASTIGPGSFATLWADRSRARGAGPAQHVLLSALPVRLRRRKTAAAS